MRSFMYVLTALAVVGLAFWAYHENYKTQEALSETAKLNREIGELRARVSVLNAEWAYLNRPDRLRDLAELNFPRMGLLPLRAEQFGRVDQVAFPPLPTTLVISDPVDVTGLGAPQGEVSQ
ncbi:cell division protein FtsL [Primorskyibacter sp. S187A]|uniref:cell division protein FtsL n=1 Tax=Primorskyibacter sp. S187A TaxID=3415130 RepID=UPI003C7DFDDE